MPTPDPADAYEQVERKAQGAPQPRHEQGPSVSAQTRKVEASAIADDPGDREFCATCGAALAYDKSGHVLYGSRLAFRDFEQILLSLGASGSDVQRLWPDDQGTGAREAEGSGLLSRPAGNSRAGSNPAPSARDAGAPWPGRPQHPGSECVPAAERGVATATSSKAADGESEEVGVRLPRASTPDAYRSERHERDYLERTIATVRNHRGADNCWPQWANIFADEIERLWAIVDGIPDAVAQAAVIGAKYARRADDP